MFGIGILELALVFFVAVIVLGPKQLPEAARTIGVWFYRLRNSAQTIQDDVEETFRTIDKKEKGADSGGDASEKKD
ncbi:MAG: twin-arginine translocase TatA/TatE family subunit [Nitrospirota bacterium]